MNKKIIKANRLTGEVTPPPSKSILHRYIIASSLAKGISKIENISYSDDIIATIEAMKKLGAKIEKKDNYLLIDGNKTFDKKYLNNNAEIDCNESGSTLRFLFPLSIVKKNKISFKGKGKLFKRPLNSYFENFDKCSIWLNVNAFNQRAIKLYEKIGFEKISEFLGDFEVQKMQKLKRYEETKEYFEEKNNIIYSKIFTMKLDRLRFLERWDRSGNKF